MTIVQCEDCGQSYGSKANFYAYHHSCRKPSLSYSFNSDDSALGYGVGISMSNEELSYYLNFNAEEKTYNFSVEEEKKPEKSSLIMNSLAFTFGIFSWFFLGIFLILGMYLLGFILGSFTQ